jgi:DNA damage-inducible protein 1
MCREHTPEAFVAVDMLYVDMAANSEPLKVFVDSGAQMTIMTAACAEKCRIMRLVDKRYESIAVGVGTSKIIGRIHACDLKVC